MPEETAIIFDCEFLTNEGSPSRYWCGPFDPDPLVVQIGAVKLKLGDDFDILETRNLFIAPVDRHGAPYALNSFFTEFTGITEDQLLREGVSLEHALASLEAFSEGSRLWSWGKDELNMIAVSCYIAGIAFPIPANRFGNACNLILKAGVPYSEVQKLRSNGLARYFGVEKSGLRKHDGLDDALSITYALQHLLRAEKLSPADFGG